MNLLWLKISLPQGQRALEIRKTAAGGRKINGWMGMIPAVWIEAFIRGVRVSTLGKGMAFLDVG
jgi:hypothetical protein